MGQRPTLPPTVFGIDEKQLAGESYVLAWRNALINIIEISDQDLGDDAYSLHQNFLTGIASDGAASSKVISRVSSIFKIPLNMLPNCEVKMAKS